MIQIEGDGSARVRCPHCRGRLVVPAGLASLPRPRVAPDGGAPRAMDDQGRLLIAPPFMAAMAGIMPWVLSAVLHFGLFLIMVFILMVSAEPQTEEPQPVGIIPFAPEPGRLGGFDNPRNRIVSDGRDARRTRIRPQRSRETGIDRGDTDTQVNLLGPGAEGSKSSADAPIGLDDRDVRGGPDFMDIPGPPGVHNIVYVVDRSGSMAASFDGIRLEMLHSISRLTSRHSFHVILFSDDEVIEGPRSGLVPADKTNRERAGQFLQKQKAVGSTTALVALRRAFRILEHADKNRPGKLIYLLSDGDFAGMIWRQPLPHRRAGRPVRQRGRPPVAPRPQPQPRGPDQHHPAGQHGPRRDRRAEDDRRGARGAVQVRQPGRAPVGRRLRRAAASSQTRTAATTPITSASQSWKDA